MKAQRHKVINASICNLPLKKRIRIILTLDLPKGYDDTLSEKLCACVPLSPCARDCIVHFIPEFCTKYRSEALQAAVDSWCKIQVIHRLLKFN